MIRVRPHRTLPRLVILIVVLGASAVWLVSAPAGEKRLSIYSGVANYSLPVSERNGQDYVGLLELLDPLGRVTARADRRDWHIRFNELEGVFTAGSDRVQMRGSHLLLPSKFLLENRRGLVPLAALNLLLPRILGGPVTFHEASRRLFIGNVGVHFTAQVNKANPPSLILNFSSSVNPMISTEAGKLEMAFSLDPLLPPGSPTLTFDSTTIPSATYLEENGIARVQVAGTVPLFASFSNNGRTITVTASPPNAARSPSPEPGAAPPPVASALAPSTPAKPAVEEKPKFFAVIDAAHGGDDAGATLDQNLPEKEITLDFARHLSESLDGKDMPAWLLRNSDVSIPVDQRAGLTNAAQPSVYLCLHASTEGSGVRIYTALLANETQTLGPLVPWNSAQSAYLPLSAIVAASVVSTLQANHIPSRSLVAPLRPLNNVTAAAIGIEISPGGQPETALTSAPYQQLVAASIAAGLSGARAALGGAR